MTNMHGMTDPWARNKVVSAASWHMLSNIWMKDDEFELDIKKLLYKQICSMFIFLFDYFIVYIAYSFTFMHLAEYTGHIQKKSQ